ncbi:MAG: hypothetical protein U0165_10365 [Polyangiaceae bacterium]
MSDPVNEWEAKYLAGTTQWDHGCAAPPLVELLNTLPANELPEGPALVPGCGAGYDVVAIAHTGRRALGLDIAPSALARFEAYRASISLSTNLASIELGDFFTHAPAQPYALIWDYTFLCAITPAQRAQWAAKMSELVAPRGQLVTLIYPAVSAEERPDGMGPPFRLNVEDVRSLLEPRWEALEIKPVVGHENRKGKEWLARWRLR